MDAVLCLVATNATLPYYYYDDEIIEIDRTWALRQIKTNKNAFVCNIACNCDFLKSLQGINQYNHEIAGL